MNVLVVDDELGLRHTLTLILEGEGHSVRAAAHGEEGLAMLAERDADLILCDVRMPKLDGTAFLERYRRTPGSALVIMMSAYGDDDAALDAMKRGAYDYIQKPFRADQVILTLNKAIEREGLRRRVASLELQLASFQAPGGIVGSSEPLRHAAALARKLAPHQSPVLITGERGTGRKLIARLIHDESPRAREPFLTVACGGIPGELLERKLFGGPASTLASDGALAEAKGGTLLLDDVDGLPLSVQDALLNVIEARAARSSGEGAPGHSDCRVIATATGDLEADVREGSFRAELFYRLSVVRIFLPPLRERSDDIPLLVRHFIELFNRRLGLRVQEATPAAMRQLIEYPWPGNVRELEHVIERAMLLADGRTLDTAHLPRAIAHPDPSVALAGAAGDLSVKRRLAALERILIERALLQTGGNRARAARLLELSPRALLYKIREYGLE